MTLDPSAVVRRYVERDDGGCDVIDDFVEVEVGGDADEVDLYVSPRTDGVVTVSMSASQAWLLARALARAAVEAERDD